MRYSVSILHVSQPGLFDTPGFPEWVQYTPKEKLVQQKREPKLPFSIS
jgi:hypothetical protein